MKRLLPLLALAVSAADAQCVMCFRTAAAQQLERARVLNIGIGIMLLPPVLILAGFYTLPTGETLLTLTPMARSKYRDILSRDSHERSCD